MFQGLWLHQCKSLQKLTVVYIILYLAMIAQTKPKKKKVKHYIVDPSKSLGKGQQGQVFLAYNQEKKQAYAVKIMKKSSIQRDQKSKNAIIHEIEIMQNVKSPNIIQFIESVESQNNIYIFQELANQGTLAQYTRNKEFGRFTQKQVIECLAQLLNGFIQLQRHGIMHRDIKPTNILVKDGIFKIADFGLSRYSGSRNSYKTTVGTPLYMAPQIFTGMIERKPCFYTEKCDIWSLGIVAFELLSGKFPWVFDPNQKSPSVLLKSIKDQCTIGFQFPQNIAISQNFKDFIRGCLKYEEENRFSWSDVYYHPIFEQKFKDIALNLENYIITDLRLKVHSQNINIDKLLSHFAQNELLEKQIFFDFLIALNPAITEKQSDNLYKVIGQGKNKVTKKLILEYLQSYQIKVKGLVGKSLPSQEENLKKASKIEKRICKGIEQNHIDLFKIYKKYYTHDQGKINRDQFNQIISTICPDINKDQLNTIFNHFNTENTPSLIFLTFYEELCQAAQVPAIREEQISNQLKKLEHKN